MGFEVPQSDILCTILRVEGPQSDVLYALLSFEVPQCDVLCAILRVEGPSLGEASLSQGPLPDNVLSKIGLKPCVFHTFEQVNSKLLALA